MARPRSPNRDKAKLLWLESGKKRLLKDIAEELLVSEEQIRKWKNQDKWDKVTLPKMKSNVTNQKSELSEKKKVVADEIEQVIRNPDLTDKQRLFCLYYVKSFNATKAYKKAYYCDEYTARVNGSRMLTFANIREEITRLKQSKFNQVMLEPEDIFEKYMQIAFADITDYTKFGKRKYTDSNTGEEVWYSYVELNESEEVDGTLISEVSKGRDGVKIKLNDRMRALQWLTDHMALATEEQKARIGYIKAQTEDLVNNSDSEKEQVHDWKAAIMEIAKRRREKESE